MGQPVVHGEVIGRDAPPLQPRAAQWIQWQITGPETGWSLVRPWAGLAASARTAAAVEASRSTCFGRPGTPATAGNVTGLIRA